MGFASRFIDIFVRHHNAANLLMALMILLGVYGLSSLNRQIMPNFGLEQISVSVQWPGASPEDVAGNIVKAIEPNVRFLDNVKKVSSTAMEGRAVTNIQYQEGTDMAKALTDIQAAVARITTFPIEIEKPIIDQTIARDPVISLEITGPFSEEALKVIARNIRDDLLDRGIEHIRIIGMRDKEFWIEITDPILRELNISLEDIAHRIAQSSVDMPSGSINTPGISRQIRSNGLARSGLELGEIEVTALASGDKIRLRDIAAIVETFDETQSSNRLGEQTSITLNIMRSKSEDTILAHKKVEDYLREIQPTLPASLTVQQYDIMAKVVTERMTMLLENALMGLLLVVGILYVFLSGRLAFWVAAGIPISIMATLGIMSMMGLSLNMISTFALIIGLGVIVDDAIVVSEQVAKLNSLHKDNPHYSVLDAVTEGTKVMFAPVMAASLTTIMAFFPILLIGSVIGQLQSELPKTIIAIIIASLIECFLVLPAHLYSSLKRSDHSKSRGWRDTFNKRFDHFRDNNFRVFVGFCLKERYSVLVFALCVLTLSIVMLTTGRVNFVFFPKIESEAIIVEFAFSPGMNRDSTINMLEEIDRAALRAEKALVNDGEKIIVTGISHIGAILGDFSKASVTGDHVGSFTLELIPGEFRHIRTKQVAAQLQKEIRPLAGLERLTIAERRRGGPPGRDIDIRIYGKDLATLKKAALETQRRLSEIPGIAALGDDLRYGKPEIIMQVTPEGKAMGFTTESVARQVRNAYSGVIAKRFSQAQEEIIVRVKVPENDAQAIALRDLYILSADKRNRVPLGEIVTFTNTLGFSGIASEDGIQQVSVTCDLDPAVTTPREVLALFDRDIAADIGQSFGVSFLLKGKADEEKEAVADARVGALLSLASIYIILAWVLASYSRPLVVMSIIPFGIIGAIFGHWCLGYNMSMFSIIGILGLSGIVVNDSIILVTTIRRKEIDGYPFFDAILLSAQERLRPVILTTLTTISGLFPILLETSKQAVLVQPMAITIVFGLIVSTTLVLGFVPALLGIINDLKPQSRRQTTPSDTEEKTLELQAE